MFTKHKSDAGFTLVELVLALALGALLMAALVGVLRGATEQLKIAQRETQQSWQAATLEQLHTDMLLASSIRASDGWIWFEGEFNEMAVEGGTTKVVGYQCVPWIDGRGALIRASDHATELVAIGPRRINIERLDNHNDPQPISPMNSSMPDRVRVWIWTENPTTPEWQRDIVVH